MKPNSLIRTINSHAVLKTAFYTLAVLGQFASEGETQIYKIPVSDDIQGKDIYNGLSMIAEAAQLDTFIGTHEYDKETREGEITFKIKPSPTKDTFLRQLQEAKFFHVVKNQVQQFKYCAEINIPMNDQRGGPLLSLPKGYETSDFAAAALALFEREGLEVCLIQDKSTTHITIKPVTPTALSRLKLLLDTIPDLSAEKARQ